MGRKKLPLTPLKKQRIGRRRKGGPAVWGIRLYTPTRAEVRGHSPSCSGEWAEVLYLGEGGENAFELELGPSRNGVAVRDGRLFWLLREVYEQ